MRTQYAGESLMEMSTTTGATGMKAGGTGREAVMVVIDPRKVRRAVNSYLGPSRNESIGNERFGDNTMPAGIKELASLAGTTDVTIHRWCSGRTTKANIYRLDAFATAVGTHVSALVVS